LKVKLAEDIFFKNQLLSLYKMSNKTFIGEFKSAFKGVGLDFNQNRIFTENDPVRQINWNLYAKLRTLYVKEYIEDRNRFNLIAVDISKSMFQKFGKKTKIEIALESALALTYSSLKSNDNTCFFLFNNEIRYFFPFNRKFGYFFKILSTLNSIYIDLLPSDKIEKIFKSIYNILKKRSQIFLISDFSFPIYFENIEFITMKHNLTSILIMEKEEEKLSSQLKNFSSNENPNLYIQIPYHQLVENATKEIKKANSDFIIINTDNDPYVILQKFFENKIIKQYQ
jgi:uncharacterized protein (DUF58 family)